MKCCGDYFDSAVSIAGDEMATMGDKEVAVKFYRTGQLHSVVRGKDVKQKTHFFLIITFYTTK